MDKILLISSAAIGLVFGAIYAAMAKMVVQAAKAIINANRQLAQPDQADANGQEQTKQSTYQPSNKGPEKVKLPARIK